VCVCVCVCVASDIRLPCLDTNYLLLMTSQCRGGSGVGCVGMCAPESVPTRHFIVFLLSVLVWVTAGLNPPENIVNYAIMNICVCVCVCLSIVSPGDKVFTVLFLLSVVLLCLHHPFSSPAFRSPLQEQQLQLCLLIFTFVSFEHWACIYTGAITSKHPAKQNTQQQIFPIITIDTGRDESFYCERYTE